MTPNVLPFYCASANLGVYGVMQDVVLQGVRRRSVRTSVSEPTCCAGVPADRTKNYPLETWTGSLSSSRKKSRSNSRSIGVGAVVIVRVVSKVLVVVLHEVRGSPMQPQIEANIDIYRC